MPTGSRLPERWGTSGRRGARTDRPSIAPRGQAYLASLAGRRVAVVGLARSGVAATRLLCEAGARVIATDAKPFGALGEEVGALERAGARLVAADADPLREVELVVVSPGVPLDGEQLEPARRRGIPIIGELELGWRATEAEAVAITGTNGKTTTTALTGALLARQGRPVTVAGNIGTPLAAEAGRVSVTPGSCWRSRAFSSRPSRLSGPAWPPS